VIEGCFEDPLAGLYALPKWVRHNLRRGVSILQKEGRLGLATRRRPQTQRDWYSGLDSKQDWTDRRPIA
jgi:hypothetical protein